MAASETQQGEWKKRETFGSALVQIILVGVILIGVVWLVWQRGTTKKELSELMKEARSHAIRGNPADLRQGLKFADDALKKESSSPDALAFIASVNTDLWLLHREPGAEQKAKEYLEKARKAQAHTEERYGSEALHLVNAGKAKEAEDFIEDLRKKGASSARLFYAHAMAARAQGNLQLARTGLIAAMDKSWKDPAYSSAWGEAIIDEGGVGATDAFTKSLGVNPDFFRAKLGMALSRVMRKDRIGEAEGVLRDVLAHDAELSPPLKARALAIQAGVLNIQDQPDQAISVAEQALALNPDDAWALFAKANALAANKDA
ncbi:MAG: tetratricopeptide repeat protein, partial [Deltaproteobacteria bacterium]|nr:tetratricopeptide repeat protein [Deltaproteobacteria bacterium]